MIFALCDGFYPKTAHVWQSMLPSPLTRCLSGAHC